MKVKVRPQKGKLSKPKGGKKNTRTGVSLPPGLEATCIVGHRFQFRATGDVSSYSVTVGNLIGICGGICTVTASKVTSWASCVKLRRITIWPACEADTATGNNPEIEYASAYGTTGDRSYVQSIPGGATVTKPVVSKPGKDTLASLWQNTSTASTTLFTLFDINKGSIIAVDVSFMLRNAVPGLDITVSSATLGAAYYLYLDGTSSPKLQPVALPNTF